MTITAENVVAVCGLIVAIGGAAAYISKAVKKALSPLKKLEERVDHHDTCLTRDNDRLRALEESAQANESAIRLILRSEMTILAHLETNNCTDKMAKTREAIEMYLVEK